MLTWRIISQGFAVALLPFAATLVRAQTYVANLDGASVASSFEAVGTTPFGSLGNGWSVLSGSGVEVFDGANNVVLNLGGSGYESYSVAYLSGTTFLPNTVYTLSFTMGYTSGPFNGAATYAFELGADNGGYSMLNSTSGSAVLGASNAGAFSTYMPHSGAANTSVTQTLNYTTGASAPAGVIAVRWSSTNPGAPTPSNADYFGFDDVKLSITAVPEPSTFAVIAGLAAVGVALSRRRRNCDA